MALDLKKQKRNPYKKYIAINLFLTGLLIIGSRITFSGTYSTFGALAASFVLIDTFVQIRDYQEFEKYGRLLSKDERKSPPSHLDDSDRRRR